MIPVFSLSCRISESYFSSLLIIYVFLNKYNNGYHQSGILSIFLFPNNQRNKSHKKGCLPQGTAMLFTVIWREQYDQTSSNDMC